MGKDIETQADAILRYMESHKRGITPLDALNNFGCLRLSARIWDLRARGYVIETKAVKGKQYARYVLIKEER